MGEEVRCKLSGLRGKTVSWIRVMTNGEIGATNLKY